MEMNNEMEILLVEDDEVDIMNIQRAFKKNHIRNQLSIVRNGLEALEFLNNKSNKRPEVVLLDINMPKMGGVEFLREMRSNPDLKSLTVIVISTSNEESDVVSAYEFNVAGYILKPVVFESFVKAISALNQYWELSKRPK